jgi:hypothetical protein
MKRILFILVVIAPLFSSGQSTMHFMERMPQNISFNPAFVPEAGFNLGLPCIGGLNIHAFNSGFDYNAFDTFYDNLGREGYHPAEFISSIGDYNTFFTESQINLLSFGFRLRKKGYLSFHATLNDKTLLKAESDLVYLFSDFDDLADEDFPLQVDDLNFYTNNYMSVGLTYSRRINEHLTLGISPHINYNIIGIKTQKISYMVEVAESQGYPEPVRDYEPTFTGEVVMGLPFEINEEALEGDELIHVGDIFPTNWEDELKISDILKNKSFSLDLGATYEINKWFFAASLLNLGASRWTSNGYVLDGSNESIKVTGEERINIGIPAKLYLGLKRQFSPKWNYGILLHNSFYYVGTRTSATVSLNGKIGRCLSTSVSYTGGYKYNNIGLGFSVRFLPGADLYFVTDNIIQIFTFKEAYRLTAASGINIAFGY